MELFLEQEAEKMIAKKAGSLSTVVGWSQLSSRKDKFRPFFFDIQSDKNPFFEVFKVPKTKGIALDKFDEIIGRFQFGIRIV